MCSTGIEKEYREFLGQFRAVPQQIIPVSAKQGDNIAQSQRQMSWYQGPTVLETLACFKKSKVAPNNRFGFRFRTSISSMRDDPGRAYYSRALEGGRPAGLLAFE